MTHLYDLEQTSGNDPTSNHIHDEITSHNHKNIGNDQVLSNGSSNLTNHTMVPIKKNSLKEETGKASDGNAYQNSMVNGLEDVSDKKSQRGKKNKIKDSSADKESKKKEKMKTVSILQLFRFADKYDIMLITVGLICACAHGSALPVMILVFGTMTDSFLGSSGVPNITDPTEMATLMGAFSDKVSTSCIYYAIIGAVVLAVGYLEVSTFLIISYRQVLKLRMKLFASVIHQEIGWFDTHETGELSTRFSDDVNKVQEGIGDKISNFFQWVSTFTVGIIIGLCYGWKLALVVLAMSPLLAAAGGLMTYLISATTSKELTAYAKAGAVAEEVFSAIRTVVAFSGQKKEEERYVKNLNQAKKFGIYKGIFNGGGMGVVFLVMYCSYAIAFWYGGQLIIRGEMSLGHVLIAFFAVVIGSVALGNAGPNLQNIGTARGAAYVLWNLIDRKSEIDSSSPDGEIIKDVIGNIDFKDVFFKYPSRKDVKRRQVQLHVFKLQILNGLNMSIKAGQTVAVVGASGCGKSTVIQLIQRFYDPESGSVAIDGVDIKKLNVKWLRQQIGIVSQEPVLFATTIAENISYGSDGILTQQQIEQAAKEANAHDFISKLPKKKEYKVSMMRVMAYNKKEWYLIVLGCIGGAINGGIQPSFAILFAKYLGVFDLRKDPSERDKGVLMFSLLFVALGVAACLSRLLQSTMFAISGEILTKRMRRLIFKHILKQNIEFFDDNNNGVGALTTRLATDASAIQGATGAQFGMAFQSLSSVGVGIIIGFIYSWQLTLLIIGCAPFIILGGMLQMKLAKGFSGKNNSALEASGKVATEAISNIRTVVSLTKEDKLKNDYYNSLIGPHKSNMKKAHIYGLAFSFSQSLIFFAYSAIFRLGAYLIEHKYLEYENMYIVFGAIIFGAMALGQASQFAPDYAKAKASIGRVFKLLDSQPSIDIYSEGGAKPTSCQGTVEFKEVSFAYPNRKAVTVLKKLNLSVSRGKTVALVGSSGCGKSTSIQLLERFYDVLQGSVMLDGVDIRSLNVMWMRSQMGLVSQEPILFDCSIRENIAYGDNSREVSMEEIMHAARLANIATFVESLPQGYETNVGDKGAQLSGGQKQRIAIARALLRNPKILLLDEATSALDTESEKIVQEALDRAQEGRTSLVIAHRLSTIQNADCIFVFHNGVVAEQGTHNELMSSRGFYYRLNVAQGSR
ncbi:hypothetical protein HELRODRAFT_188615 [Helobdella robusta]|uniref:Bile salt export pump n=1 Tax=Helobdella robusta TaxID=6412 RepID=T1FQ67_HELRO|nr:hypothetical protein HELRODRAFT_188615 [Helobdella robusta]ESO02187.1 hypothetical protein HELRODRAFT_188615 [Helobdella robusta]